MLIAATKRENTMISTIITTAIVINFAHFTKIAVWITGQSKFKFTTCILALQPHSRRHCLWKEQKIFIASEVYCNSCLDVLQPN